MGGVSAFVDSDLNTHPRRHRSPGAEGPLKVLLLGLGAQGGPCASILARDPEVEEVRVGCREGPRIREVLKKIDDAKLTLVTLDASSVEEITRAARGVDVIIDMMSLSVSTNAMAAAIRARVHYVNTSWDEVVMLGEAGGGLTVDTKYRFHGEFERYGLTALLGCGMTPGCATNVLIRLYADKLDTVDSVKIRLGKRDTSIPRGAELLRPWRPSWSPRQALLDFVSPSTKFEDGRYVLVKEPLAERRG